MRFPAGCRFCPVVLLLGALTGSCDRSTPPQTLSPGQPPSAPLSTDWPLSKEDAIKLQEAEAKRLGVPVAGRLNFDESVSLDLVFIPPGTFPMGNPASKTCPSRLVRISRGFFISKCEVTWRQYLCLVSLSELDLMLKGSVKDMKENNRFEYPASVDWIHANKFLKNLSKNFGITSHLPTEAEWEYACRAGTDRLYGEWDSIDDTKARINYWKGPDGKEGFTQSKEVCLIPVGQFQPNRWGIHDMMGNANEWCLDSYIDNADLGKLPSMDPVGDEPGSVFRAARGGNFTTAKTVYDRDGDAESGSGRGIRVVIEVNDAAKAKIKAR